MWVDVKLAGAMQLIFGSMGCQSVWVDVKLAGAMQLIFGSMCHVAHGHLKDYYQRLTYTAADRSERMLTDVLRHGVHRSARGNSIYQPYPAELTTPKSRPGS